MARGKALESIEKGKIMAFHEEGLGFREIGRRINRSDKVVRHFLRNPDAYGLAKSTGRKSSLAARQKREIRRNATNSTKTCAVIAKECAVNSSKWTIARVIKSADHLKRQKMKLAPKLTRMHREKRLEFGRNHMQTDWSKIIFSDEKKINLDGPDGLKSYWRDLRKEPRYFSKRNFGGGSVMAWGAFCADGLLEIAFPISRMNSSEYVGVLEISLSPFLEARGTKYWRYQQDNAIIHVSRETRSWFESLNVALLDWPACSPDLNPMENVWGIMVRRIYANNMQYNSVSDLKTAIIEAYMGMETSTIKNLIRSMPNTLFEVIKDKGGVTHY